MLITFSVENFKSFKNKATLDMRKTNIKDLSNTTFEACDNHLLSVATIYGPNASGKSNFIKSINFLAKFAINYAVDKNETLERDSKIIFSKNSFRFDENNQKPIKFEIEFISDGLEYEYILHILNEEILFESAYYVDGEDYSLIFERNAVNNTIELFDDLKEIKPILDKTNNRTSFLGFIKENFDIMHITNMNNWFENIEFNNLHFYFYEVLRFNMPMKSYNNDDKKGLLKFINTFEPSILDIKYIINDDKVEDIKFIRKINNSKFETSLFEESEGTVKMLFLYDKVKESSEKGIPLVVDELDIKLHPILLRSLIINFHNRDIFKQAQLITTLHDVTVLNNKTLRRDEIWFVAKDENLVSELYTLYEVKGKNGERVRNDAIYFKDYLNGYYGATPNIKGVE